MGPGTKRRGHLTGASLDACAAAFQKITDRYIDLYQVHASIRFTPIDETLGAARYLVQHG